MGSIRPPTPDTRLPFKGSMAFDRNTQEYIPFRTETDAMLASLMLAYRLASPVLAVVLALVRHPNFNPADITLSKPEDIWTRVAEHNAAKPPPRVTSFSSLFPRVILSEVADILGEERRAALYVQRDTDGPQMGLIEYDKTDRDLRSVSLVCRDWREPAQRTLGKILTIQDIRSANIINAINSPMFGSWTNEMVIFRHYRDVDEHGQAEYLVNHNVDIWDLMAKLVARTPNIRSISFCTDWFDLPVHRLAGSFANAPVEELHLVQVGDIAQLLGAVCKQVKHMPMLRHLALQYSGQGSAYTYSIPQSELDADSPGPALEKVSLKIGSASALSLRYIKWLTRPRDGENGFRLGSLALDLTRCYYNEHDCVEALEPCFTTLSDLWINVSGLSEGVLDRIFRSCQELKSLTIVIRHTFDNSFSEMPRTVERLCINFSFEEADWGLWDERMKIFLTRGCPSRLRHLSIQLVAHSAAFATRPDDTFTKSRGVAEERGIEVHISWITMRNSGCTPGTCSTTPIACY